MSSSVYTRVVVDWKAVERQRKKDEAQREAAEEARRRREKELLAVLHARSVELIESLRAIRQQVVATQGKPGVRGLNLSDVALAEDAGTPSVEVASRRNGRLQDLLLQSRMALNDAALVDCITALKGTVGAAPPRAQAVRAAPTQDPGLAEAMAQIAELRRVARSPRLLSEFQALADRIGGAANAAFRQAWLVDLATKVQQENRAFDDMGQRRVEAATRLADLIDAGEAAGADISVALRRAAGDLDRGPTPELMAHAATRLESLRATQARDHAARVIAEELTALGYAVDDGFARVFAATGTVQLQNPALGAYSLDVEVSEGGKMRFELSAEGVAGGGAVARAEDRRHQAMMCDHLGKVLTRAGERGVDAQGLTMTEAGATEVRRRPRRHNEYVALHARTRDLRDL